MAHALGCLGLCLSLLCALAFAVRAEPAQDDTEPRAQLLRLSQRRIFFGHQSVGMNLLDGVRELARYQAKLTALRARYPRTVFVHITAHLTTVEGGAKAALKRLLGHRPGGLLENARRDEFNELLRRAYGGKEPVFDLAHLESTAADGQRELHGWNGRKVPALLAAYTVDGHLNAKARLRFARELIALFASLP